MKKFPNNRFDSRTGIEQTEGKCHVRKNQTKLLLDWRHRQENRCFYFLVKRMFESPAVIATRPLHWHPYKIAIVREIHDTNHEVRMNFVNRYFIGGGVKLKKETAHSFSLAMRFGFVSRATQNLRRTGSILQKIPCECS